MGDEGCETHAGRSPRQLACISMIHLERDLVMVPAVFSSKEMEAELAKLSDFYARPAPDRSQRSYRTNWRLKKDALPAALALSYKKCAYCETPETSGIIDLDSFRPKSDAVSLDGS